MAGKHLENEIGVDMAAVLQAMNQTLSKDQEDGAPANYLTLAEYLASFHAMLDEYLSENFSKGSYHPADLLMETETLVKAAWHTVYAFPAKK